jgi:hypothetical protein
MPGTPPVGTRTNAEAGPAGRADNAGLEGLSVALDHYVSQVHLRNFYSPKLKGLMYAIRKTDLKSFVTKAEDVCRIDNGSTNPYLQETRAIEEFLKGVEPKYNEAINKIANGKIDLECVYIIAGFVAYIITCSPAGMRIQSESLEESVKEVSRIIDKQGLYPTPPPELGAKSLTELMDSGKVLIEIDPKYPQAIGISSILSLTSTLGNFKWEILINSFDELAFLQVISLLQ